MIEVRDHDPLLRRNRTYLFVDPVEAQAALQDLLERTFVNILCEQSRRGACFSLGSQCTKRILRLDLQ